ncbi:aldehyde dehydrogenase family protein [Actinoplanes bogorensis]|uniref:Aldehyde dehydrogenase family protein n=1 Tax=Paractinoplanes bogorensis TaxID=1610840 RepID=A0ABS5YZM8_9ACTN|nr:aldehyde dehydrogenase family protein [Actinoplanes bogorensis]MBU2668900.1 aldehyde dehydrogenase family protein [Actinoplanes bogorensis]
MDFRNRLLIDGEFVDALSGKTFDTHNPADGSVLATVAEGQTEDVDRAVASARKAFEEGAWSRAVPADRQAMLWKLADLLEQNAEEMALIESLDNGKPLGDARGDVAEAVACLRYYAGWATKISGRTVEMSRPGPWHAYTLRQPLGVVGQIVPWNFPLIMTSWKIGPALAAGNAVVLKPAEQTPLTALRLGELALEAGFPPGALNVVTGDGPTAGAAIAAHPDVDKVAFTGSTETGRLIVQAALGNFKKVSLELGGKSPNIVLADADIEAATSGAAMAIFSNQGEVCTAASRLYVERSVFDRVVEGLAGLAGDIRLGAGTAEGTQMGPLVSAEHLDRVSSLVQQGVDGGARVVTGGGRHGDEGYFYRPTVLTDVTEDSVVVQQEIFGPVVVASPFDAPEQIGRAVNNTVYGLAAGIWTRDLSAAHRIAAEVKAGTVYVNTYHSGDAALPFGGFKQSGWGRELGEEGLELYTETKSVVMKL